MAKKFDLHDSKVWSDLHKQSKAGRKRSALITDIDDTFYKAGHDGAVQAAWDLRAKANDAPYPIIAVTGGDYEQLVRGRLESKELPELDVLVTSVGTEIRYLASDGSYRKDEVYDGLLKRTGYDRLRIVRAVQKILADNFAITFQNSAEEISYVKTPDLLYLPYKVSLHFYAEDDPNEVARLFAREFPDCKIVVCEAIDQSATPRKKYCLDIVAANKADAVNYLIQKLELSRGVVAGDSGNDIDMLLDTPGSFVAVAVGGHKTELRAALEAHKAANKTHKTIYIDTAKDRLAAQTLLLSDSFLRGNQIEYKL